jgi:hypothetical protein
MNRQLRASSAAGVWALIGAAAAFAPGMALAQPAAAPTAAFSAPVESLKLGGAKAGFMESGSAAGGLQMLVRTSESGSQIFGKTKTRLNNAFRFMKGETEVTLAGTCTIRTEGRSMFNINFSQNKARAYSCAFKDQPETAYAMEVSLPAFAEARIAGAFASMSISKGGSDAEQQSILKARLVYKGVVYDATPTGFGPDRMGARRVVQGYNISRDGKLLGRLAYRQTGVTSAKDQGDITIPTADADGREAVLFMIMALNAMPDVYASLVRQEISWQ